VAFEKIFLIKEKTNLNVQVSIVTSKPPRRVIRITKASLYKIGKHLETMKYCLDWTWKLKKNF